jgi:hypothetical protein
VHGANGSDPSVDYESFFRPASPVQP